MVLFAGCIILSTKRICNKTLRWDSIICGYIISFTCLFQAIYGVMQWGQQSLPFEKFSISGSFDNPAGYAACLCTGFPFILQYLHTTREKWKLFILGFSVFLVMLALFLSGSRAGIIGSLAVVIAFLSQRIYTSRKGKNILLVSTLMIILFIIGSYFLKKDSADGRLLIWKCSWEMIKESPVYGHGTGVFLKHYMDYQAKYFDKHPDSQFAMLADNVQHPFNEYLSIILNFGFIGGVLLFAVMILLFCACRKNPNPTNITALLSLLATAVLAVFSYPFIYPFTWIVGLYCICILLKGFFIWKIPPICHRFIYSIVLIFCITFLYHLYQRTEAEYQWYKAYKSKQLSEYKQLMLVMGNDPYFLYNYAVELYNANHVAESKEIALLCHEQWANYDLELLLGDIYMRENDIASAESHYKQAALMCPCRFIPLYQLFCLYQEQGNESLAYDFAKKIEAKEVKVSSTTVKQIKYKVKLYMREHCKQMERKNYEGT